MLPWQIKSILIIFEVPPKMLCFAVICPDLPSISCLLFFPSLWHRNPKRGKMWQIDAVNRSKNVVEIKGSYYRSISRLFYHKNVNFSSPIFKRKNALPKQSVNRTTLLNCSEHFLINRLFAFQLFLLSTCILNLLHSFQFVRCILKSKVRVSVEGNSNFRVPHKVLQGLWIHACSCHIAAVGMPANVRSDVRHLHSVNIVVAFVNL